MANKNVTPPLFPIAPTEYSQQFMDQLLNMLRLYLSQSNNAGPMIASSQNVGSTTSPVISGMTFAAPDPADRTQFKISLPTDADFAYLRSGDVYYDTSGGAATSYPLRIKA
jgi:hypothetical protein